MMVHRTTLATLFAAMSFATSTASAHLITFDDLTDNGNGTAISNGYSGLDWDNFNVLNTVGLIPSGFVNGTASFANIAFNDQANPTTISSSTGFNLLSGKFTGAWNDGLQIDAVAFSSADIYSTSFTVNSTSASDIVI